MATRLGPYGSYPVPSKKKPAPPKSPPKRPPVRPWAGLPGPASGGYSSYLGYGTGFNMYGHHFTSSDQAAFEAALRAHGVDPRRWYANHPGAAKAFDPVAQMIYGNVTPQLTGIAQQRKDAQDYYNRMMSSLTNFATALMPYLQQVPAVVAGAYEQGAKADTLLGQGYGGQFDVNQSQNAQGIRDTLGQLGLQGGPAASKDAGVVSALGGGLEADILKAAGPAYANAAAQWPKQASLEAQDVMNQLLGQAASANKGFDSQVSQVLQSIPGMQASFQNQVQSQKLAEQRYQLEVIRQQEEAAYKNWYIAKTNRNDKEAQYWKRQQDALERQRIALEQGNLDLSTRRQTASENKAMGLNAAGTQPLPGYKWKDPNDPSQGTVKLPNPRSGTGPNGKPLREGEMPGAIRAKANDDLEKWIKGHKPGSKWTYREAHRLLYQKYIGYVGRTFKNEAEFERMINEILSSRGITPGRTFTVGLG